MYHKDEMLDIFQPQDDIWKPDLSLSNTFARFIGMGSSYLNIQIEHDGRVQWKPAMVGIRISVQYGV